MREAGSSARRRQLFGIGSAVLGLLLFETAAANEIKHNASPSAQEQSAPTPMMGGDKGQMILGHMQMVSGTARLMMPRMDAVRGRELFASKGCVACHSINGVGGHDATSLDAHTMDRTMNPFEFAAKMWRMAPAMIYAQEEALGYQIQFTGDELADIIAFVHNDEEQHKFSEADIPPEVGKMMHHTHGEPGGGSGAHGEDLGHMHHSGSMDDHHED